MKEESEEVRRTRDQVTRKRNGESKKVWQKVILKDERTRVGEGLMCRTRNPELT